MELTIGAEAKPLPQTKIDLLLVGKKYKINRIKPAVALRMARLAKGGATELEMVEALDELIVKVFGEKDAKEVQNRLEDPKDALDYDHISELLRAMMTTKSGEEENPTG